MAFRSHLGRSFDLRHWSNAAFSVLVALTAVGAFLLYVNGRAPEVLWAPVHAFVMWALLREVDPDHHWSALAAGAAAGGWVLSGGALPSALAVAGLMLAARLITATTGRRPLPVDLAFTGIYGAALGFTLQGWVAGFGIALAHYLDTKFSGELRRPQLWAAAVTATGATVVASLAEVFPDRIPQVRPVVVIAAGTVALILIGRHPAVPVSTVDARHGAFLEKERLHTSRAVIGILVFVITLSLGLDAATQIPVITGLLIAVASNEVERQRRRSG